MRRRWQQKEHTQSKSFKSTSTSNSGRDKANREQGWGDEKRGQRRFILSYQTKSECVCVRAKGMKKLTRNKIGMKLEIGESIWNGLGGEGEGTDWEALDTQRRMTDKV